MRRIFNGLMAVAMAIGASGWAGAENVTLLDLKSTLYDVVGPEALFSITLATDQATDIVITAGGVSKTYSLKVGDNTFQGYPGAEGRITITGDQDHVFALTTNGGYVTEIDLSEWTKLEQLDLSHNELKGIDLSKHTLLKSLDISDNPFVGDQMIFAAEYPLMEQVNVSVIDQFNYIGLPLTTMPNLVSFVGYSMRGWSSLDFSYNPKIQQVSINNTDVRSVQLSGAANPELRILNLGDCGASIYEGYNQFKKLRELYLDHETGGYKLESVDVSGLTELVYLFLQGNKLKELDVSKNTKLQSLFVGNNQLSTLDLSKNSELTELMIRRNDFTYATLPEPLPQYGRYEYTYQHAMEVDMEYKVGSEVDLRDKVIREGSSTTCMAYTYPETDPLDQTILIAGTDYTYENGIVTLLKEQANPVVLVFENSLFPSSGSEGDLTTTPFLVRSAADYGKPVKAFSFVPEAGQAYTVSVNVEKAGGGYFPWGEYPTLYVDANDGNGLKPLPYNYGYEVTGDGRGNPVYVYCPLDAQISSLRATNQKFVSMDLTKLYALTSLSLSNVGLLSIDLQWNKSLKTLMLPDNELAYIDLSAPNISFRKNSLTYVDISNNKLASFVWDDMSPLQTLNLGGNQLSELGLDNAESLQTLDVNYNQLTNIDLSFSKKLNSLNIANNKFTTLEMPNNEWYSLNIAGNAFTFATMPHWVRPNSAANYTYAPQADIKIPSKGPGVSLSSQVFTEEREYYDSNWNLKTGEFTTEFAWFKEDGTKLTEGTDYTLKDGVTTFINPSGQGKVYCEISNGAYPAFSGENALKTTLMEAAEAPDRLVATFTTTAASADGAYMVMRSSSAGSNIFFDWGTGEVTGYDIQDLNGSAEIIPVATEAAKDVKVYSYADSPELAVFSMTGVPMKDFKLVDLKNLRTLTLNGCALTEVDATQMAGIRELSLSNNALREFDAKVLGPDVFSLALSNNQLTDVDLSFLSGLNWLYLDGNQFTTVGLEGLGALTALSVTGNQLTEIDLSPCRGLTQVMLSNNELTSLDISKNQVLNTLYITGNRFTFATLPLPTATLRNYQYHNQAWIEAEVKDGNIVDLADQAAVDGVETAFYWFDTEWTYDRETGELTVDPLKEGTDFTIEDGVTTFLKPFDNVYALLQNAALPKINLGANASGVKGSIEAVGIGEAGFTVSVEGGEITVATEAGALVNVFDAQGRLAARMIADGDGYARSGRVASGVYIVKSGTVAAKVAVR